jgi:ubiquinone/menaquinone biosynthesis C-methylase UbiE
MFDRTAALYDAIYSFKNYAAECQRLRELIASHKRSAGRTLLDVACGTGAHLATLSRDFDCDGLDLNDELLAIARAKCPGIRFHHGDMVDFDLGRQFDVVTCLFSAIGYVRTVPHLRQAVANLARHVCAGGVLMVEPWILPHDVKPGYVHGLWVDQPELKVARMGTHAVVDGVSVLDMYYLVATPGKVDYYIERHELGLFARDDYLASFRDAGLVTTWNDPGLMGRGLVIGEKPLV